MSVTQPSRVPAGVPAGGRFASSRHTDPGTDLLERSDAATERELFDRFTASARHWGNRLGVDTDDLLQDTAVEFYATMARQRGADDPQPGLNGRVVNTADRPRQSTMVNPGGWIHRIAYNIAARRVAGTNSSADLAALREYRNRLQQTENECGRELSVAEADRLADEIRMSRPPRRRPTPGFHRRPRTVSTEALGPDWDQPIESNPLGSSEFRAHTAGAAAEKRLTANGNRGRVASALAWDAVADVTGAPVVVPDVIDPHSSRDAARLVDDAGGAVAVSRRWAHDPADQAVAALFTPFGRLDTDEQRAVIRTIHRSGGYGDQVWSAALRSATCRPRRSTG